MENIIKLITAKNLNQFRNTLVEFRDLENEDLITVTLFFIVKANTELLNPEYLDFMYENDDSPMIKEVLFRRDMNDVEWKLKLNKIEMELVK